MKTKRAVERMLELYKTKKANTLNALMHDPHRMKHLLDNAYQLGAIQVCEDVLKPDVPMLSEYDDAVHRLMNARLDVIKLGRASGMSFEDLLEVVNVNEVKIRLLAELKEDN